MIAFVALISFVLILAFIALVSIESDMMRIADELRGITLELAARRHERNGK